MRFTNYEVFLVRCLNALGLFVLVVVLYAAGKFSSEIISRMMGH
jgi:hypothetical protein